MFFLFCFFLSPVNGLLTFQSRFIFSPPFLSICKHPAFVFWTLCFSLQLCFILSQTFQSVFSLCLCSVVLYFLQFLYILSLFEFLSYFLLFIYLYASLKAVSIFLIFIRYKYGKTHTQTNKQTSLELLFLFLYFLLFFHECLFFNIYGSSIYLFLRVIQSTGHIT